MPSCLRPRVPIEGVLVSNIRKCIPKNWKQSANHLEELRNTRCSNSYESEPASDSSKDRDVSVLDSLLNSVRNCACKGLLFEAFRVFSLVQHLAFSSSPFSCSQRCHLIVLPVSSLLEACATDYRFLPQGLQLHAYVISLGVHRHPHLLPRLVTFYSEFNLLFEADVILESSRTSNPLPWNVLISAYVRNGLCKDALSLYQSMLSLGVKPDKFTYPTVIKACGEDLNLELGMEVHRSVDACTRQWNLFAQNALISMYAKCGEIEVARRLFDELPERDAVSWNSIVSVCASMGMLDEAFVLFEKMLKEFSDASVITWNTMAGGLLKRGNSEGTLEFLSRMRAFGLRLDPISMIICLNACTQLQAGRIGNEIHAASFRGGFNEYQNVQNALITMYSRCEDLKHAIIVFQRVQNKSIVTWNSMISGYSHMDRPNEAFFLFREMLLSGIKPNFVTIASILPLVAQMANLQYGKEFHCYITKHKELKDCLLTSNTLVGMYAKSGEIMQAKRIFDALIKRDKITYTSLISGYGSHGQGEIALKFFDEMIKSNIKPDEISMVAVLKACSHSGLIHEGQILFKKMTSEYHIDPTLEHFACMVDLFGRAGLLRKAQAIITTMPYQPTLEILATFLGACQASKNIELEKWAATKLLEMRPEKSGFYMTTGNMYGSDGGKFAPVKTFVGDHDERKDPEYASVDIGGTFQSFAVKDASTEILTNTYFLLEVLAKQMKDSGSLRSKTLMDQTIVVME